MTKFNIEIEEINKKFFEFAKDIDKLNKSKKGKQEILNLLKTHVSYANEHLVLNKYSILSTILLKAAFINQIDETGANNFLNLSVLKQLRRIKKEEDIIDKNILKKVKKDIMPHLTKYLKLNKPLPSPFDHKWVFSSQRSTRNISLYNLLIQKSRNIQNLSEIDKSLMILNYYLMLIEGPFEDNIDFIFSLILMVNGELIVPNWNPGKTKKIKKLSEILRDNFTLGRKKNALLHYNMSYLSNCLNNDLRNQIAHLKYNIDENGQIILEDGTLINNLPDLQEELWDIIRSINKILLEQQHKLNEPGIEEILNKISESIKNGKNPFEFQSLLPY